MFHQGCMRALEIKGLKFELKWFKNGYNERLAFGKIAHPTESRLESSNLHMQTGVKNFLIRLLRVSLWPRSPKMTATGFSQRGTQNASLYS